MASVVAVVMALFRIAYGAVVGLVAMVGLVAVLALSSCLCPSEICKLAQCFGTYLSCPPLGSCRGATAAPSICTPQSAPRM